MCALVAKVYFCRVFQHQHHRHQRLAGENTTCRPTFVCLIRALALRAPSLFTATLTLYHGIRVRNPCMFFCFVRSFYSTILQPKGICTTITSPWPVRGLSSAAASTTSPTTCSSAPSTSKTKSSTARRTRSVHYRIVCIPKTNCAHYFGLWKLCTKSHMLNVSHCMFATLVDSKHFKDNNDAVGVGRFSVHLCGVL